MSRTSTTTTCDNPLCSCDPCLCDNCHCGAARLGELERRVMDILWDEPERAMTGRDVARQLPENAYTTVATALVRFAQNLSQAEVAVLRRSLRDGDHKPRH